MPRHDSGAKEMLAREDNMKFPPSMKLERRKPESKLDGMSPGQMAAFMSGGNGGQIATVASPTIASPTVASPTVASPTFTSPPVQAVQHPSYIPVDGPSGEEEGSDSSLERPKSPTSGEFINTNQLIALSQALMRVPPGGPVGFASGAVDGNIPRPGAQRPAWIESSSQPGALPAPLNTQFNGRPGRVYLAPDEKGNEIRPDAMWTKIDRRLVSPEVLNQDGRRYEA